MPSSDGSDVCARGQTTLDFTTGVSTFLIVLLAVFLFIPGSVAPFTQGGQDNIATANRVGDTLSEGLLGDPADPHILNTTCTIEFFEGNSPSYCRFDGASLGERIGVADRTFVNVTLQGNLSSEGPYEEQDILCWDTNQQLAEKSDATCDTLFAIGDTPPNKSSTTVTSRRVVSINRSSVNGNTTDVALVVEVW